jgi:hypothetical protein
MCGGRICATEQRVFSSHAFSLAHGIAETMSETVSVLQQTEQRYPEDGPKAETKGTLKNPHGGGRLAKAGKSAQGVRQRFLALPQSLVAQAVAENWHVMAIVSKCGKERKDSPVPCYCFPGT